MSFETVKIKKKSGSQTITLPDSLRIDDDKVYLKKVGNSIHVIPFHHPWGSLIQSVDHFTDDYLEERSEPGIQERELFE
jgi:antitoxin VapB